MTFWFEILGTIAFAVSGAMVGIEQKMDIFGVTMLGMTTAIGGGIIRDLIIGVNPPVAFQSPSYAIVSIVVSLLVFIPYIRKKIDTNHPLLITIDAIGLGVFTVVGVKAGECFDNLFLEVFLGMLTGVGGGVLRDMMAAQKPLIFVKHFYALASICGALTCSLLYSIIGEDLAMLCGAALIVVLREFAAKYKWHLPKA